MKKLKRSQLFTHSQVKKLLLDTPTKRKRYEKHYKKFVEENKREILGELGEQVRKARNKVGVTQEELARRLKTTRSTIARVEKGNQNLTVEYIVKVAVALGRPYEVRIY